MLSEQPAGKGKGNRTGCSTTTKDYEEGVLGGSLAAAAVEPNFPLLSSTSPEGPSGDLFLS